MSNESPEDVVKRLSIAMRNNQVIDYGVGMADREFPAITWARYGLIETNEIVVTATVATLCLGIAGQSPLIYPVMIDRVFGPDVDDEALASELSEQLWNAQSRRLIAEASRVQQGDSAESRRPPEGTNS